jgi:polyhydroxyalkanoate synthesis regulator protein
MQAQQEAFLKAMTGGMPGAWPGVAKSAPKEEKAEDLGDIKRQLAELQEKLSKLS